MRRGFSIPELLIGIVLALLVVAGAWTLLRFVRASGEQTLAPHMGLQMASRAALVRLVNELQECVEFVRPRQGASSNYFLARDKLNLILTGYTARDDAASKLAGRDIFALYLHRHDYLPGADPSRQRRALEGIERAAFTTLSPGLLQLHLTLHEQGKSYTLLTTVRARNVLSEAEL